jgi:hypothetical protein
MKTTILLAIWILALPALGQMDSEQKAVLFENGKKAAFKVQSPKQGAKVAQTTTLEQRDSSDYTSWSQSNATWQSSPQIKTFDYVYNTSNDIIAYTKKSWVGNTWLTNSKFMFTYNPNHVLTSTSNIIWNGAKWVNYYRYTYTYDANDRLTGYLFETGNDSIWENSDQEIYTYVGSQNTYFLRQTWNGASWDNVKNESNTYDSNNNMITKVSQTWGAGAWINNMKDSAGYNLNNEKISSLSRKWKSNAWNNFKRTAFTYSLNQSVSVMQAWDTTMVAWENDLRTVSDFDPNNNLVNEVFQTWESGAWKNIVQNHFTWGGTAGDVITNSVYQVWNDTIWTTTGTYDQVYNTNGFLQTEIHKGWNNAGTMITSGDSTYHYSHTIVTGINDVSQTKNVTIYPNPAISELNIATVADYKSVKIINSLGETIRIESDRPELISVSDLTNGVYFIQLIDKKGKALKTQKFIKN